MPTVIPFHRAVVDDAAFIGTGSDTDGSFGVYTSWIETEFDNRIPPYDGEGEADTPTAERRSVTVEVGGRRLEVVLPADLAAQAPADGARKPRRERRKRTGAAVSGDAVTSPMQGTIVKVAVSDGDEVEEGDVIVVLEAMKMEQPLKAHKAGTVTALTAEVGGSVSSGAVICELT
jgi:acetyl-CoA/propionyl-CoA carboxylase, biotin carboxylase, biotin carboxyl carrier protein